MSKEIFKDIPNYKGMYQVSNLGNVKSLKRKKHIILKQSKCSTNYYSVCLSNNGNNYKIHTHILVARVFLNHTQYGNNNNIVDHINNISTDNRVENLQLITQRENLSKDKISASKYVGVDVKGKKMES